MKLQKGKPNNQFFINLPNKIVKAKNWNKGELLEVLINSEGDLVIKKVSEREKNEQNKRKQNRSTIS